MRTHDEPKPIGEDEHGPVYDGSELAAWRMAMGVDQAEVADRMRTTVSPVTRVENMERAPEKRVAPYMRAVVYRATIRERMRVQGIVNLDAIRARRELTGQEGS
jgi:transcriptional regulator with XRE-family HTH domain